MKLRFISDQANELRRWGHSGVGLTMSQSAPRHDVLNCVDSKNRCRFYMERTTRSLKGLPFSVFMPLNNTCVFVITPLISACFWHRRHVFSMPPSSLFAIMLFRFVHLISLLCVICRWWSCMRTNVCTVHPCRLLPIVIS